MASTRHEESVNILLNYESNLNDTLQKDNRAMKSIETQIKNNQAYIDKMENSTRKLSAQSQNLLNKRKEENSLLEKKLQLLQKENTFNNQMNTNFEKYFKQMVTHLNTIAQSNEKILNTRKKTLDTEKDITKEKEKQSKAEAKKEARSTFLGAFDTEFSSSFSHKLGTTAQYIAAGSAIMGVAATFSALAKSAFEAELNMRTMAAVLELNVGQATKLSENVRKLGETYGGSTEEIENVALALGRAGIKQEDLVDSTKVVLQMARLTGDTFEQSSNAIISFQQVFGDTTSIELLGDKLAYVANVSRLSTHDIGTFANYALAAAKNVGLTEDAVGGLAAAFSNAGVNASTIGTQIRRFTTLMTDDSKAVTAFFEGIGVNQKNLLFELQSDAKTSNAAMIEFAKRLQALDETDFANLIGGMDLLAANSLQLIRNNAGNIEKFVKDLQDDVEGQLKNTEVILDAYIVRFENSWNALKNLVAKGFQSDAANAIATAISMGADIITGDFKEADLSALAYFKQVHIKELTQLQDEYNQGLIKQEDYLTKEVELRTKINTLEEKAKGLKGVVNVDKKDDAAELVAQRKNLENRALRLEKLIKTRGGTVTGDEADIKAHLQGYNVTAALVTELENKLNKVSEASKSAGNSVATSLDVVARNVRSKASLGKDIKEDLKLLDSTYQAELDLIANNRALALEEVFDKSTKELIEQTRKGGLAGLSYEFNKTKVDIDKLRRDDKSDKKLIADKIKVQNLLEQEIKFEEQIIEKELTRDSVLKSLNKSRKEGTNEQIRYDREALKGYILQKQLEGVEFDKVALLKLEIADREKYNATQKKELITQTDINTLLEAKLALKKAEEEVDKKKARIQSELLRKELDFRIKLDELKRKDFRGVGRTRENDILDIKSRLVENRKFQEEAEQQEDLVKRADDLNKLKLTEYELTQQLAVEQNRLNSAIKTGAIDALEAYGNAAVDTYSQVKDLITSSLSAMEDAFVNFAMTGKLSFKDMANSIISDIIRIQLRTQLLGPLAGAIGGYFAGAPGMGGASWLTNNASVASGAISYNATGGELPKRNFTSGGLLVGGSGFKDDIYLGKVGNTQAFAMGGEFITRQSSVNNNTRDTLEYINKTGTVPSGAGNVTVNTPVSINISNESGTPLEAEVISQMLKQRDDGFEERVVNVIIKRTRTDPGFNALLRR